MGILCNEFSTLCSELEGKDAEVKDLKKSLAQKKGEMNTLTARLADAEVARKTCEDTQRVVEARMKKLEESHSKAKTKWKEDFLSSDEYQRMKIESHDRGVKAMIKATYRHDPNFDMSFLGAKAVDYVGQLKIKDAQRTKSGERSSTPRADDGP